MQWHNEATYQRLKDKREHISNLKILLHNVTRNKHGLTKTADFDQFYAYFGILWTYLFVTIPEGKKVSILIVLYSTCWMQIWVKQSIKGIQNDNTLTQKLNCFIFQFTSYFDLMPLETRSNIVYLYVVLYRLTSWRWLPGIPSRFCLVIVSYCQLLTPGL